MLQLRRSSLALLHILLTVLVSATAIASHTTVYIDAVHGDDSNSGLSASDAFRTISAATTAFPAGQVEYRLTPDVYDVAHGETFPIVIPDGGTLQYWPFPDVRNSSMNEAGGPRPIIDAGGAPVAVLLGNGDPLFPATRYSTNVEIRNAGRGVVMAGGQSSTFFGTSIAGFHFRDCDIGLDIAPGSAFTSDYYWVANSVFENCRVGIRASGATEAGVRRCSFRDISEVGILVASLTELTLGDSQFLRCSTGVYLHPGSPSSPTPTEVTAAKTLFARCGRGIALGEGTPGDLTFNGACLTFADSLVGIETLNAPTSPPMLGASLYGSIFARNVEGIRESQPGLAVDTTISFQSGILPGTNVRNVDPRFEAPASGDYRLSPFSPVIDALPASWPGDWFYFPIDGDQDGAASHDYGALEFSPLEFADVRNRGFVRLFRAGTTTELRVAGAPGGGFIGLVSLGLASTPIDTPFGSLALDTTRLVREVVGTIDPATGWGRWTRATPADPALIGTPLFLQAIASSRNTPARARLTEFLFARIVP